MMEFGLDTFGDVTTDAAGALLPHAQVIRNVIEEGVRADQAGIDVFGLGEHHRRDYAVSTPEIVLAAIAARTARIRLGSAVTVLSSDDPVRVFQRFSSLDAVSNGRAEIILGRGSFTESFPLFGYALSDYQALFEEKLALFAALRQGGPVTWQGRTRAKLTDQSVYPSVEHGLLPTWVGVGGSPDSIVRAAQYNLPVMLAIIGGDPGRFTRFVDLHRRAYEHLGRPPQPLGVHSPGYVADTDAQARDEFWLPYKGQHDLIGAERGWPPMRRAEFDHEATHGSLYVGSPETVAAKIARTAGLLGLSRFNLKYSAGRLPHERSLRAIELYGTRVIPLVRDMLARSQQAPDISRDP